MKGDRSSSRNRRTSIRRISKNTSTLLLVAEVAGAVLPLETVVELTEVADHKKWYSSIS